MYKCNKCDSDFHTFFIENPVCWFCGSLLEEVFNTDAVEQFVSVALKFLINKRNLSDKEKALVKKYSFAERN